MRRLIANPRAVLLLRATLASSAIAWGLGQLQQLREIAEERLTALETEAAQAEARLARLLEAEEEARAEHRMTDECPGCVDPDPAAEVMDGVEVHIPPAGGWAADHDAGLTLTVHP